MYNKASPVYLEAAFPWFPKNLSVPYTLSIEFADKCFPEIPIYDHDHAQSVDPITAQSFEDAS